MWKICIAQSGIAFAGASLEVEPTELVADELASEVTMSLDDCCEVSEDVPAGSLDVSIGASVVESGPSPDVVSAGASVAG